MLNLSIEQLEQIEQFGILKYSVDKICLLLDIESKEEFKHEFANLNSAIRKEYEKGFSDGQTALDITLFNIAKSGDVDAMKMIRENAITQDRLSLRKQLFGI